tara:strand:+ start:38 stop:1141 length:1104 start_codon:yes stop_codon:yes gene_type:complete
MSTNPKSDIKKNYFMRLALLQAYKTLGNTKTNPAVGCVIVKDNCLISAGSTSLNGRPHAEFNAINDSFKKTKDSDLYVTLEPCSNFGKTPPCVNLIYKKKIKRVYFSITDPDLRSKNKSFNNLISHGISVKKNILKKSIKNFYRSYYKYKNKKLPFVTCKLAVSKDFFTKSRKKKWITNKYCRGRVHLMRSQHDCLLTTSKTIKDDDPKLTCRINGLKKTTPARVILDNKLIISTNSRVIKDASNYQTIIFYNKVNKKKIKLLKKLKVKTYHVPLDAKNDLDLLYSLTKIKELGFSRIFLESGIKLIMEFSKKNLIDDFKLFVSNNYLKKYGKLSIKKYFKLLTKSRIGEIEKVNLFGEKLLSYKLK